MYRSLFILFYLLLLLPSCSKENSGEPAVPGGIGGPVGNEWVTVMSYNTRHCAPYYGVSGEETVPDVDGIANVIKSKMPDVVLLQEIDSCTTRSLGIDQAKEIAARAKYPYYHFFRIMDYRSGEYGLAMLSKKPFKETKTYLFPDEIEGQVMTSDNAVGTAIINIGGTDITFAVTHLSTIQSERDLQITYALENIFEPIKRPIVLGGDFNATPSNSTIAILDAAGFTRTNTDPTKFTIPSNNPNRELDYITYYPNDRFRVVSHMVITGVNASDHLPIISVLEIKP